MNERERSRPDINSSLITHHSSLSFIDLVVELLSLGYPVSFQAQGRSNPTIQADEVITVEPVKPSQVKRGDIILYRFEKGVIAHRMIRRERRKVLLSPQSSVLSTFFLLRGDASDTCDDPVAPWQVLGKVVAVQREGRKVALKRRRVHLLRPVRRGLSRLKRWLGQRKRSARGLYWVLKWTKKA